jgi:MFS family permease
MAASQAWQLYVGRVLLGLGAGLEITISPVYIHETTKSEMRDVCGSFPQVLYTSVLRSRPAALGKKK